MTHVCADHGIVGIGNPNARVMLIGIAPGKTEWESTREPFTGESGKLAQTLLLDYAGLEREDVWLTNGLCWWNDSPTPEEFALCRERLLDEIRRVKPHFIVLLGKLITESLSNLEFGKARGGVFWDETFDCWIMATNHPAAYLYKDSKVDIADAVRDFRKLKHEFYFGGPETVPYTVPNSLQEIDLYLQHFQFDSFHKVHDVVAIDVECYYRSQDAMRSISFTCKCGTFHIPEHLVYGPHYEYLLRSDMRWTYHNGQFDRQKIKKYLGVDLLIHEDTMLQSYSLDERCGDDEENDAGGTSRAVGIHGLKSLAREYFGAGFYEDFGKDENVETIDAKRLAEYNARDTHYTFALQALFERWQIEDNVRDMYLDLLIPGANVASEITERGIYIDESALLELGMYWSEEWLDIEAKIQTLAVELGWKDNSAADAKIAYLAEPWINLDSPQQIAKLIYDICGHSRTLDSFQSPVAPRTTRRNSMLEIAEEASALGEWVSLVLEWRGRKKDLDDFVFKIDDARDKNNRVHSEILLHATRNGRTAMHNPPFQTVPKPHTVGEERARIRRIVSVPDGYVLVEADNRQSELWSASMVSHDSQMLEDLESGDFHTKGAEGVFGFVKAELVQTDELRYKLLRESYKRICYNNLYGGGPDSLIGKGTHNAGKFVVVESRAKAIEVIRTFDRRFPEYHAWREAEKKSVMQTGEQQSISGRKRRYYWVRNFHTLNQTVNTPISALSHDFLMKAWIELHPMMPALESYILMECHDSILFEIKEERLDEALEIIERVMTQPRFGLPYGIPIDIKMGYNWFDMVDKAQWDSGDLTRAEDSKMAGRSSGDNMTSSTRWKEPK